MAISKVILNGVTQMDVTQKTVDASNLLSGYTAGTSRRVKALMRGCKYRTVRDKGRLLEDGLVCQNYQHWGAGDRFPFHEGRSLMGDTAITFTLSDVLWLCGAVCTVAAAIAVFYRAMVKAHEPEHIQDQRLDALEQQVKKFAEYLDRDNRRLNSLDEGNRVTQQALLALMSHAINGNDIDKLSRAKDDLESYLINRGGGTIS